MLFLIKSGSVTCAPCNGFSPEGERLTGHRHWPEGSSVEFDQQDAKALLEAGVIEPVVKPPKPVAPVDVSAKSVSPEAPAEAEKPKGKKSEA